MKIHQLFRTHIPDDLLLKLLECFGYSRENMSSDIMFSKHDLERNNTIQRVNALKDELSKYYLPCKAKVYLSALDEKKCVTILRQVLRLHGYLLSSKQRYVKQKKTTFYYIQKQTSRDLSTNNHSSIRIDTGTKIITFV